MTRTFTGIASVLPTGRMTFSCRTRSQLHLQPHRHIADLIEHQCTAVSGHEQSTVRARGACEGAFLMAEQLGLEQVLRHGAAVDGDEGFIATRARLVDGAGQQFFTCAAFTGDQDACIGAATM